MNHVCLEERTNGLLELEQAYLHMYPLQYGGEGTADSDEAYWSKLGVKDLEGNHIFGRPTFKPVTTSPAYAFPERTVYFHGSTLMPECFWHSHSPGHWIFPLSAIFELARKNTTIFPEFDRLALLKCVSWHQHLREWEWGKLTLEAALDPLVEKGLFHTYPSSADISEPYTDLDVPYPLPHIFTPLRRNLTYHLEPYLLCFENLHIVARWSVMVNSSDDAVAFRESLLKTKLKRDPKSKTDVMISPLTDKTVPDRCKEKSLRVGIYLRYKHWTRNLINEDEILNTTLKYTHQAVIKRIFAPPMDEQLEMYNSFDILISTYGSHLVNLMFTNRTRVAVIEVGLAIRDLFWRENALRLGINNYYYSMAGSDGDEQCYKEKKMDKRCTIQPDGQTVICPPSHKGVLWNAIGDCSFTLNASIFEKQLVNAIHNLCK